MPIPAIAGQSMLVAVELFSKILDGELAKTREREQTVRAVYFMKLQAMVASERIAAQKEILTLLIQTSQHVFDRKLDAMQHSFDTAMQFLRDHQSHLLAEKSELARSLLQAATDREHITLSEQISDIDKQLMALDHRTMELDRDFRVLVHLLELEIPGGTSGFLAGR